ncbi:helix-turn-helix domain-containing protein [Fusobacterium phage FNU_1P]|nr:helix-turn-helix domain-containing protein [Fusobacterium phage FNU_1P]
MRILKKIKGGDFMINTLKLKAKLKEKNLTQEEVANRLGINPSTFNKKINNEIGETLTIQEATNLKNILEITNKDMVDIFFAN